MKHEIKMQSAKEINVGNRVWATIRRESFQNGEIVAVNEDWALIYFYFAGITRDYNFAIKTPKCLIMQIENTDRLVFRNDTGSFNRNQYVSFYNRAKVEVNEIINHIKFETA